MGYLDFRSTIAETLWKQIDEWFPKGKWGDPPEIKRGEENKVYKWWREAYDDLLKTSKNFEGIQRYNERATKTPLDELRWKLSFLPTIDNDATRRANMVHALQNDFKDLIGALPDLNKLRESANLRKGLAEAIETFTDRTVSALKHTAVLAENDARRESKDNSANWQKFVDTLIFLKFMERSDTIRDWTGRLPTDLRMKDNESPEKYFELATKEIPDIAKEAGKLEDLKNTLSKLTNFQKEMESPGNRLEQLKWLNASTVLLERLGSTLASGEVKADDKQKTAWEAMVFMEGLNDVFGEKRAGGGPGYRQPDHPFDYKQIEKFKELAKTAVEEVERDKRKERWERRK
jgi:hypothetical protein